MNHKLNSQDSLALGRRLQEARKALGFTQQWVADHLVHMRKIALAGDVKPNVIARGTPGFSGADLANLVNEAALFAARAGKRFVDMEEFERAKDKVMMGAERRSMVMSDEEKKLTAYHEAGHAIVGRSVPGHDPVYKVSIIPRGRTLPPLMWPLFTRLKEETITY